MRRPRKTLLYLQAEPKKIQAEHAEWRPRKKNDEPVYASSYILLIL